MSKPTLLAVDDEPLNLAVLARLLSPDYRVLGARSGPEALALLEHETPELLLLDVMMPGMDGFAVLRALRQVPRTRELPVIFVTALGGEFDEEHGLALGAADYIVKPIKPAVLLARVRTQIELLHARRAAAHHRAWLENELGLRIREGLLAQDLMLFAIAELAEARDDDTGQHVMRTQAYVQVLAERLQSSPVHRDALAPPALARIVKAAAMHDIGKIGIPDRILLKPGRLTAEEFEIMKTHARIGGQAIERAIAKATAAVGGPSAAPAEVSESLHFLEVARDIAAHHHERWDGQGYPDGLAGAAIPLPARLMAVADSFDALTSPRVYKQSWPPERAFEHVESEAGRQFDPDVVRACLDTREAFLDILSRQADPGGAR